MPDWLAGEPWVRCPPQARSMPRKVSPGCSRVKKTAWLAWAPEWGWTLAKAAPNSSLARSRARSSVTSTNSQPP
ncbi:hypothetical protein D3C75_1108150 [compost metagenome]